MEFSFPIAKNTSNPENINISTSADKDQTAKAARLFFKLITITSQAFGYKEIAEISRASNRIYRWIEIDQKSNELLTDLNESFSDIIKNPKSLATFMWSLSSLLKYSQIPLEAYLNKLSDDDQSEDMITLNDRLKAAARGAKGMGIAINAQKLTSENLLLNGREVLSFSWLLAVNLQLKEVAFVIALIQTTMELSKILSTSRTIGYPEQLQLIKANALSTINLHANQVQALIEAPDKATAAAMTEDIMTVINQSRAILASCNNDGIDSEISEYARGLKAVLEIYDLKVPPSFNQEVDALRASCQPLIEFRLRLQNTSESALNHLSGYLDKQKHKLDQEFNQFKLKINKEDYDKYYQPEYEKAANMLMDQRMKCEKYLEELTPGLYGSEISPFMLCDIKEQEEWSEEVLTFCQNTTSEIGKFVKYACREL